MGDKEWMPNIGEAAVDYDQYFFSAWYEKLKICTFPTVSLSLTKQEAEAIIHYRKQARFLYYLSTHPKEQTQELPEEEIERRAREEEQRGLAWSNMGIIRYPKVKGKGGEWWEEALEGLERKLEMGVGEWGVGEEGEGGEGKGERGGSGGEGYFIKLSCRSPKDAALLQKKIKGILEEELFLALGEEGEREKRDEKEREERGEKEERGEERKEKKEREEIIKSLVFGRASLYSLRCLKAKDSLFLLLNSQRVYDDLRIYLDRFEGGGGGEREGEEGKGGEGEGKQQGKRERVEGGEQQSPFSSLPSPPPPPVTWDMKILLRKWENIDPTAELRGFVYDNELVTLCQYYENNYVPHLADKRYQEIYQQSIISLFSSLICPALSHLKNYSIDFAPLRNDPSKVFVVEINPPPPLAGTPMIWSFPLASSSSSSPSSPSSPSSSSLSPPTIKEILCSEELQVRYVKKNEQNNCCYPPFVEKYFSEIFPSSLSSSSLSPSSSSSSSSSSSLFASCSIL